MLHPDAGRAHLRTSSPRSDHFVAKTEPPASTSTFSSPGKRGGTHVVEATFATISSPIIKRARLSAPEDDENGVRGAVMVESVKTAIWNALNHYAFEDAVFAAERLYAEGITEETAFLLATCLYRAGQKHRALEILSRCPPDHQANSDIRYLLGKIYYDLEQFPKAEIVLANCPPFGKPYGPEDVENLYKPDTCSFGLQLLGNIHHKSQRKDMAAASLKRAVSLNPFQWSSFESICRMKDDISAKDIFFRSVSKSSHFEAQPVEEIDDSVVMVKSDEDVDMVSADEDRGTPLVPSLPPSPVKVINMARKSVVRIQRIGTPGGAPGGPSSGSGKTQMRNIVEEPVSTPHSPIVPMPPVISSCFRTPNNYASPQSSHSQLNLSQDSPNIRNSSLILVKKKTAKPPFRVSTANSSTAQDSLFRSRQQSVEISSPPSTLSSPSQPLRRSTRLQANNNKTSSAVKENKTLKKRDDFDSNGKLNRRGRLENSLNIKSENVFDVVEKSENGLPVKKASVEKPEKESILILRQKRKKEPTITVVLPPAVAEPLSETTLTEQERLTALVMRSYCRFGEVVQLLHKYDIIGAMDKLISISPEQREAPFYWYLKGRLHFENLEYDKAVSAFEEMRRKDPCYIKGVDYYSVALWQLQREKDLAVLAKYLIDNHRDLPETYIVYGNVFSVQREHEYAVKMFRRALQLNPNHAYALTMVGHEYASMDERDKAAQCFRLAIHADPSHYNGWYGLGMIEYKKENYPAALANFKKALDIYPTNPLILVQLGVAQHALKHTADALRTLSLAVASFPNNPLCRFQKASLLYSLGHLDKAMEELEKLKELAPKESLVYFLMGKVSKRTDNTHMALMYFSKAMDLDPKGTNNQIKEAFNKLYGGMEDDVVPQRAASGTTSSRDSQASSSL